MELKEFCNSYISSIEERIKESFEEHFLGKHLSKQIRGQVDEYKRELYYHVIENIINKHYESIKRYKESILKTIEDYQAKFTSTLAIRRLFERGILSLRDDRNVKAISGSKNIISCFLAISNSIIKSCSEDDLAFLDQVEFSDYSEDVMGKESSMIHRYCDNILSGDSEKVKEGLENLVNFLANKNFVKFKSGQEKVLKEKLKDAIKIILQSLRENLKCDIVDCAEFLVKQAFGQNLLFEILVFTKFIKLGFLAIPKCKIRCREQEDVTEFDTLVLIEELESKPILLVEVTTRSTSENLREKIEKIREAHQLLKEEFSSEVFIPLLIGYKESIESCRENEKQPIPILFDFDEFFSHQINNKDKFLDELKRRYGPGLA